MGLSCRDGNGPHCSSSSTQTPLHVKQLQGSIRSDGFLHSVVRRQTAAPGTMGNAELRGSASADTTVVAHAASPRCISSKCSIRALLLRPPTPAAQLRRPCAPLPSSSQSWSSPVLHSHPTGGTAEVADVGAGAGAPSKHSECGRPAPVAPPCSDARRSPWAERRRCGRGSVMRHRGGMGGGGDRACSQRERCWRMKRTTRVFNLFPWKLLGPSGNPSTAVKGYFSLKQNDDDNRKPNQRLRNEVSVALGRFECPPRRMQIFYLFFPRAASTSSSGFSECHWAMGRRGLASMSDQCRSSVPVELKPVKILPMASFLPSLS